MPTTWIDAQLYSFKVVNQMIQCKDFAPRITERGPFGGPAEYESFSEVVSAVNQWIEKYNDTGDQCWNRCFTRSNRRHKWWGLRSDGQ